MEGMGTMFVFLVLALSSIPAEGRGRGRGRSRGWRQYSMHWVGPENDRFDESNQHPRAGARIVRSSHFYQAFKLGYKIKLICIADGEPPPQMLWLKGDVELDMRKRNLHLVEMKNGTTVKSKIEIDPATVGDQGIYQCRANNRYGSDLKDFKTEYYF